MRVVFMEEVEGTARIGEVKNVADGFARNYLLPRRLAAPATDHYITIAQARAEKEAKRQDRLDEEARKHLVPKVEGRSLTIEVRVGEQGKLFGSVTARDIAEALQEATGIELEHRQVDLRQPIREIGVQEVTVKLTRSVLVPISVSVEPIGGLAEGEEAPEGEAEAAEVAAQPAEAVAVEAPVEQPAAEAEAEEPEAEEVAPEPEGEAEPEPEAAVDLVPDRRRRHSSRRVRSRRRTSATSAGPTPSSSAATAISRSSWAPIAPSPNATVHIRSTSSRRCARPKR